MDRRHGADGVQQVQVWTVGGGLAPGFGRYGTAAVGARSASRLAWIPYAARRSCRTPLCRWLRSACSAIRAQCWAKLSRESNVSGSKVTSAIFRQSHATSLYSSAAFIGIAKALLCASPVPCARNRPWAFAVPGPDLKISNGMSFGTGALPKFMSGRRSSRSQLTQEAARCSAASQFRRILSLLWACLYLRRFLPNLGPAPAGLSLGPSSLLGPCCTTVRQKQRDVASLTSLARQGD
jgi:hypothetical protein